MNLSLIIIDVAASICLKNIKETLIHKTGMKRKKQQLDVPCNFFLCLCTTYISFFDFKIMFVRENLGCSLYKCISKIQFDYENIKHGKSLRYDSRYY